MKVKSKIGNTELIKDKWYEVITEVVGFFQIDNKDLDWIRCDYFYTKEELREQKINEILNES